MASGSPKNLKLYTLTTVLKPSTYVVCMGIVLLFLQVQVCNLQLVSVITFLCVLVCSLQLLCCTVYYVCNDVLSSTYTECTPNHFRCAVRELKRINFRMRFDGLQHEHILIRKQSVIGNTTYMRCGLETLNCKLNIYIHMYFIYFWLSGGVAVF